MSSVEPESPRHRPLAVRDRSRTHDSAAKRKRTLTNGAPGPQQTTARRRTLEPDVEEDGSDEGDYDPDQPMEQRREVQRGLRNLIKGLSENNDEYLQADSFGLHETLRKANALAAGVRQTTEATIDSRLLVNTVDASWRKTVRLTSGNVAQGLDVDEFVSKCITYMRLGAGIEEDNAPELTATQQQRRRPNRGSLRPQHDNGGGGAEDDEDLDEVGDEGDMLNWEHLGRFAALRSVQRPAVPGFLLGPLSVEKKVRKIAKRSAPFRPGNLAETRPQVLDVEQVQRAETNDLTAICSKILQTLRDHQERAQGEVGDAYDAGASEDEVASMMQRCGLRETGGIDLLKFVINPQSFGQTVENLFYVSFLIRDARVKIEFDSNDLPTLAPIEQDEESGPRKGHGSQKFQAIFNLDMRTWRDLIDAFDITEPIIEHRPEQSTQGPGARGWYS